jgi:FkbM family methyltransferase
MSTQTPPSRPTLSSRLSRRWHNRKLYRSAADWLWSLYNRLLISRIGCYFPLRGRIRPVHLSALDKPLWIRLGTTDWLVLDHIYHHAQYDSILKQNLGDVRNILDLGSNIGMSIRLWQVHYPGAKIVGVEPDDQNLSICRRNAAEAGENNVHLVHACVAASPRTVYLNRELGEWGIIMTDTPTGKAGETGVPAKTVPVILNEAHITGPIDLLKCDIEGAERELFADCSAWIGHVRHLLVELHGDYTAAKFREDVERNGGQFEYQILFEGGNHAVLLLKQR